MQRRWIPIIVIAVLLLAGILFDFLASIGWLPACPLYRFTGLSCAGCGATRGLHALLRGNLAECFRMNALLLPMLALIVLLGFRPKLLQKPLLWIGLPIVVILFVLIRNLF